MFFRGIVNALNRISDAIIDQNRLLEEQNRQLKRIADEMDPNKIIGVTADHSGPTIRP